MSAPAHAIEVEGLVRQFKRGPRAVDEINLHVSEGEIYGFLGPNGAGKTTTVRMLTTLLPPSGGRAFVGGFDVARQGPQVRAVIGAALQEAALDPVLTAREHVLLQAGLHGYPVSEGKQRADDLLKRVGLSGAGNRRVGTYSGGMKRRLDLALALVHRPRILFLDEPTTGLDPQSRSALWDEVNRLRRDEGVTIFLTTQYLEEADVLADRVGIIDQGRIVAEGTPSDLKAEVGRPTVEVIPERAEDLTNLEEVLAAFGDRVPSSATGVAVRVRRDAAALPDVVRALDSANIQIANLTLHAPTLDDVFLNKTGRSLEGEGGSAEVEPQVEIAEEIEAPAPPPKVDLEAAAAGRTKIERLPTTMLKDWMAERQLKEAQNAAREGLAVTPSLEITTGPLARKRFQVEDALVLGREGDLVIADPEISRRHALLRIVDGSLVIDDMQSLNGTWVNGKRIGLPTLLAPGDTIELGNTTIGVQD